MSDREGQDFGVRSGTAAPPAASVAKLHSANTAPIQAPCSDTLQRQQHRCTGTLQQHQRPSSSVPLQQHSAAGPAIAAPCSGTLQRHPAAATATKLQSANSTLTQAPCSSILQRHPAAAPLTKLQTQTCNPSSLLGVRTPIALLSGKKRRPLGPASHLAKLGMQCMCLGRIEDMARHHFLHLCTCRCKRGF